MPKCSLCHKSVANKKDLTLVRNKQGRWVVLCVNCNQAAQGGQKAAKQAPAHASSGPSSLRIPKALRARRLAETQETFEKIREMLRHIHTKNTEITRTHEREHERRSTNLEVRFKLQRDNELYTGLVQDISEGGMCFITKQKLSVGQVILLEVNAMSGESNTQMLHSTGEVRRVMEQGDGTCEVGIRYVQRIRANEDNRRRYRRYKANMAVYYSLSGSEYMVKGKVLDISQGGARFILDEQVKVGDEFAVILRGEGRNPLKADLYGMARAMRVKRLGRDEYEVGCEFLEVRAQPQTGKKGKN